MSTQTATVNKTENRVNVRYLTVTAMLSAVAYILMFLDFSVPFMPAFIKMDLSELPALIGSFAMGPLCGVVVCLIKNVLHLFITTTGGVGELSNFILGVAFVLPAGLIYKHKKNRKSALIGSLAGAVVGYFANLFPNDPPKFVVMEAEAADCLYQGALANDGKPRIVTGDLKTIMAGLACGEPNTISWDILRNHVSAFISCPDWVSAKGMRMLSSPVKGDPRVVSGESGAVGMGVLDAIMCDDTYKELRDALELDRHSRVLMFSTEGNTDPEKYRRVVWDGEYPTDDTPQKPC